MAFEVGGEKAGFDKNTFLEAFKESGLNAVASGKLISRMCGCRAKWEGLIAESFLPDNLKEEYLNLIRSKVSLLAE